MITLGFDGSYIALNQDGLTDSRLTSAITQAVRDGPVTPDGHASVDSGLILPNRWGPPQPAAHTRLGLVTLAFLNR